MPRARAKKLPATYRADPEGPRLIPLNATLSEDEAVAKNAASAWISLAAEALAVWERKEKQPRADAAKAGE